LARYWFIHLLIFAYGLLLGVGAWELAQREFGEDSKEPGKAVILAVNDVYRINGVAEGRLGGLARLRTLRAELAQAHPDLLLLHAGDIIHPSLLSRLYGGQQMIDGLNLLDGRRKRGTFDERFFAVFGNHEFDESDCAEPDELRGRVLESEFTWLASNIDFSTCHGHPAFFQNLDSIKQSVLVESGGIKVGLFGLTIAFDDDEAKRQPTVLPYQQVARKVSKDLRQKGAQVVIAVTHLNIDDDLALLSALGDEGPDVVVGGHDHQRMALPAETPRVFKADADAVSASVIEITLGKDGKPIIAHRFEELDERMAKDLLVQQVVDHWLHRHATEFCAKDSKPASCLDTVVGHSRTEIEAEELANRNRETNLGDWIADRMLEKRSDAEVAMLNSGTLRLNYNLPARAMLRERHLRELIGFPVSLLAFDITGAQLWSAMQNAIARRGSGGWAHIAGAALQLTTDEQQQLQLGGLLVKRRNGTVVQVSPDSMERFRLVTSAFLACGGDGYDFGLDLSPYDGDREACQDRIQGQVDAMGAEIDLLQVVRRSIEQANKPKGNEEAGIAPKVDGRICMAASQPCLFTNWQKSLQD